MASAALDTVFQKQNPVFRIPAEQSGQCLKQGWTPRIPLPEEIRKNLPPHTKAIAKPVKARAKAAENLLQFLNGRIFLIPAVPNQGHPAIRNQDPPFCPF